MTIPEFSTIFHIMFSLFRRKPEPAQAARTSPAILDLNERMERVERVVRDLRTDWDGVYDKFHRLNMRLAKRQKALESAEDEEDAKTAREDRPGATNGGRTIRNPLAEQLLRRGRL